MKFRESGMPVEQLWSTFFEPDRILAEMDVDENIRTLVDIGCGYGTFLIPAARIVGGRVVGIDIDMETISVCSKNVKDQLVDNVDLIHGDISNNDNLCTLMEYKGEIDYVCLFNILHCEEPVALLKKVNGILSDKGKAGIIHWKHEQTPRGPSMEIRPEPESIIQWALEAGFVLNKQVELLPYHFGLVFSK